MNGPAAARFGKKNRLQPSHGCRDTHLVGHACGEQAKRYASRSCDRKSLSSRIPVCTHPLLVPNFYILSRIRGRLLHGQKRQQETPPHQTRPTALLQRCVLRSMSLLVEPAICNRWGNSTSLLAWANFDPSICARIPSE